MPLFSLFHAADDCLVNYLDDVAFANSLLMNLLFQDHVLIDESHAFNSRLLVEHVRAALSKGQTSLFAEAAREGLLLPLSLDGPLESMEQAEQKLRKRYGADYEFVQIADPVLKKAITGSLDNGLRAASQTPLPKAQGHFAEFYLQILREKLQRTDPPPVSAAESAKESSERDLNIQAIWPATAKWRFEVIEAAVTLTARKNQLGLQRAQLFNALGWELGVPTSNKTVGIDEILGLFSASAADPDPQLQAVQAFLRWITQFHHLTRAHITGAEASLPVHFLKQDFFVDSFPAGPEPKSLTVGLTLPPSSWLFGDGVPHILAVRHSYGETVLAAIDAFAGDPTAANEESLRANVKHYGDLLCQRCPSPAFSVREIIIDPLVVGGGLFGSLTILHNALHVAAAPSLAVVLPVVSGVSGLVKAAQSLRNYQKKRFATKRHQVWHELTVPAAVARPSAA